MDQHEYVLGCQRYYAENYYEPGNPEDGDWHDCHYPVPECLGGTKTVKLLKQHHAVQGVLQSEEHQHPCIYGWERKYLPEELQPVYDKWKSVIGKIGGNSSAEHRRNRLTPDEFTISMTQLAKLSRPSRRKSVKVVFPDRSIVYSSREEAAEALGVLRQTLYKWLTGVNQSYLRKGIIMLQAD
jgi:hypothetical protein